MDPRPHIFENATESGAVPQWVSAPVGTTRRKTVQRSHGLLACRKKSNSLGTLNTDWVQHDSLNLEGISSLHCFESWDQ